MAGFEDRASARERTPSQNRNRQASQGRAYPFQLVPGGTEVSSGSASFELSPEEVRRVEIVGNPPWPQPPARPSRTVRDLTQEFNQQGGPVPRPSVHVTHMTTQNDAPDRDVERLGVSGGPSDAGSGGSTPAGIGPTAAPPEVGMCPRCQDRGIVGRLCTRCPGSIRFLPFQQAMDLIQQHNEHQQWMQEQAKPAATRYGSSWPA